MISEGRWGQVGELVYELSPSQLHDPASVLAEILFSAVMSSGHAVVTVKHQFCHRNVSYINFPLVQNNYALHLPPPPHPSARSGRPSSPLPASCFLKPRH